MHDLEIRGAGNLLGEQQSGQIHAVGFELYTEMMEKAIQELKGEDVLPDVDPEIRLGIPAYFPDSYIPDANQRLYFYKRLASLRDDQELAELKEEIIDRFGAYTTVVENLFLVMNLRRTLKQFLVQQISVAEGRAYLLFHPESPMKIDKLLELIQKQKNGLRLTPDGRLSFTPKNLDWEPLIEEVTELLGSIQERPSRPGFSAESLNASPS
jgi:transcription-repair coupling factor (superfamily II helicase)